MEETPGAFMTYTGDLLEAVQPIIARAVEEEPRKQIIELSIVQDLAGIYRTPPPAPDVTDDELYAVDLFRSAHEIDHAVTVLLDHEVYVRRFPYGDTRVSRVRHLRTTVEGYYQKVYILRERLRRHTNLIEKHFASTRRAPAVRETLKPVRKAIDQALGNLLRARGAHVHETRLSSPDLERIDSIQFLADISDDAAPYEGILMQQYVEVRHAWRDRLRNNNKQVATLLDIVFGYVRDLVVSEEGELRYPSEFV